MSRVIVDIDGTICDTPVVAGSNHYAAAKPILCRIVKINRLYDEGHTIGYWTARGASTGIDWTELTTKQLKEWGCKYHELRCDKPDYSLWIDDKAINDKAYFRD